MEPQKFRLRVRVHLPERTLKLLSFVSKSSPMQDILDDTKRQLAKFYPLKNQEQLSLYKFNILLKVTQTVYPTFQNNDIVDVRPRKGEQKKTRKHLSKRIRKKIKSLKVSSSSQIQRQAEIDPTTDAQKKNSEIPQENSQNYLLEQGALSQATRSELQHLKSNLQPFHEESMKQWTVEQNKLLNTMKIIDQILLGLRELRQKQRQSFAKVCSSASFIHDYHIQLTHLKKILWLDHSIYQIKFVNKSLTIGLPTKTKLIERISQFQRKIQQWRKGNKDKPIPQCELAGELKKVQYYQHQRKQAKRTNEQIRPFDILHQRKTGVNFGKLIEDIVKQKQAKLKRSKSEE